MKLIGKQGVEVTLRSVSLSPTKYLSFLKDKGALLRITQVSKACTHIMLFLLPYSTFRGY